MGHFLVSWLLFGNWRKSPKPAAPPCQHPPSAIDRVWVPGELEHRESCFHCGAIRMVTHVYGPWIPDRFPPPHLCLPSTSGKKS